MTVRSPIEAIAAVRRQSTGTTPLRRYGMCKQETRLAYNVNSDGSATAAIAWTRTKHRLGTDLSKLPIGALLWWTGGSEGAGHVAIYAGNDRCWSVDILRPKFWDSVPVEQISRSWPLVKFVGASRDIEGVLVVPKPTFDHTHRHVHANIQQTMPEEKIRDDVRTVFAEKPDSAAFNELNADSRDEIEKLSKAKRYGHVFGPDALNQLGVIWDLDRYSLIEAASKRSTKGRTGVTPDRGRLRVTLRDRKTGKLVKIVVTHLIAQAWTTSDKLTRFRKAQWFVQYRGLVGSVRRNGASGICIYSLDANKPKTSWTDNKPFPALTSKLKGWKTAVVASTGATFGKATYDYVGIASKSITVAATATRVENLHSDHHAVIVALGWD